MKATVYKAQCGESEAAGPWGMIQCYVDLNVSGAEVRVFPNVFVDHASAEQVQTALENHKDERLVAEIIAPEGQPAFKSNWLKAQEEGQRGRMTYQLAPGATIKLMGWEPRNAGGGRAKLDLSVLAAPAPKAPAAPAPK